MPGKKKKSVSLSSPLVKRVALALALVLVGYGSYILGSMESMNFHASMSKDKAKQSIHENKTLSFYNIIKAEMAGVKTDPALGDDFFARHLSADLAAKYKTSGPAVLFCSDRSPDTMSVSALNAGGVVVHEHFFNSPGQAATSKSVLIGFENSKDPLSMGVTDKINSITCP